MLIRVRTLAVVCAGILWVLGCSRAAEPSAGAKTAESPPPAAPAAPVPAGAGAEQQASLRRIVKKASLELVVARPSDAAEAAARIAEREGGFVASTERDQAASDGHAELGRLLLTLRVRADRFTPALEALRRLGTGSGAETVSTEDVSEEFIDLDARINNQQNLEAQFLEILKRATKVEDALNVQRELATVRTEIESMQGRRRFLERETALSTIALSLVPEAPLVRATFHDFTRAVGRAASDTVDVSAAIVTGSIRVLGVLLPFAAVFGLPLLFALRARHRRRLAATPEP
jgi:hypothetical protein